MHKSSQRAVELIRDTPYSSCSHTFNRAVIVAYNNVERYPDSSVDAQCLRVPQQQRTLVFLLAPSSYDEAYATPGRRLVLLSETEFACSVPYSEIEYVLDDLFRVPSKQVRRGITLSRRPDISIDVLSHAPDALFADWVTHKRADPKVYQIAFNPDRYIRSFRLVEKGFSSFQKLVSVRGVEYGAITFNVCGEYAYELAFVSRYWQPDLRIINDLNESIFIWCLYQLYKRGVRYVNVGPHAGIKGLRAFKTQFPYREVKVYRCSIIRDERARVPGESGWVPLL